jgi:hypothetical protein
VFEVPAAYFLGEIELTAGELRGQPVDEATPPLPDEPLPPGLARLIESGFVLTTSELRRARADADWRHREADAPPSWDWAPQQWLDLVMELRRLAWGRRLRTDGEPDGSEPRDEISPE